MTSWPPICIIGAGRLAQSLVPALQNAGAEVVQVLSRRASSAESLAKTRGVERWDEFLPGMLDERVGLVWLCTPDGAISEVVSTLAQRPHPERRIFVHSSGSTSLEILAPLGTRTGIIYPLQMFTGEGGVDFREVPIFCEASSPDLLGLLHAWAQSISEKVQTLGSHQRLHLHLSAVWAINFSNILLRVAQKELASEGIDFEVLHPLLAEQLKRVQTLGPEKAQTGPAIRGDVSTLHQHLALLTDKPDLKALYIELSKLINPEVPLE